MTNKEYFKQAGFGMMIHWGLYSLPAGEWKGQRMSGIGEWIQHYYSIPNSEYHSLAEAFNPILFNAEEIVSIAESAGMKYITITSKHHEGFAMFKSDVSKFNIYDATHFKRDIIAELAEACYKHNMKFGVYYSQELDWAEKDGGGFAYLAPWMGPRLIDNHWDFPDRSVKDYSRCYNEKILPQVSELLTKYGELFNIWFDTPVNITKEQSQTLYDLVKKYQPNCLVNSRIGNGVGDYGSFGDNEIPESVKTEGLFETPATLNDTWGYKAFDNNYKDPEQVIVNKRHLNSIGVNYLLNVGIDYLGRIPAPAISILQQVGKIDK